MDGHVSREQRIAQVQEVMLQVTKHQKYRLLWRILKNSNDDNGVRIGPIGHFRVPLGLARFQNEGRCSAFDREIIFHSHANKTHFLKKGCVPSLILKVRVFGTRKWPIC